MPRRRRKLTAEDAKYAEWEGTEGHEGEGTTTDGHGAVNPKSQDAAAEEPQPRFESPQEKRTDHKGRAKLNRRGAKGRRRAGAATKAKGRKNTTDGLR